MHEKHVALALALAKSLLDTREQFVYAVREAAMSRLGARLSNSISRSALEPIVDDALYQMSRDGLARLEDNVRSVVDEVVREALESARTGRPKP